MDETRARMLRAWDAAGTPERTMADWLGISRSRVNQLLGDLGLRRVPPSREVSRARRKAKRHAEAEARAAEREAARAKLRRAAVIAYRETGTLSATARRLGCSVLKVWALLVEAGEPRHPRGRRHHDRR